MGNIFGSLIAHATLFVLLVIVTRDMEGKVHVLLDANKTANGLIARYEKFGRNCRYECASYGTAYCDDGTCAISDERPEEPGPVDLGTGDTGR